MDFYSAYAQGFARVAACTLPVALADPGANARDRARAGAGLPRRRRRGRGLPRAVPERLLDRRPVPAGHPAGRRQDAIADDRRGVSADLLPVLVVGAPLVHGTRVLNCAVVDPPRARSSASRRSPTCPTTASSTSGAGSPRATTGAARSIRVAGRRCRFGPDLIFARHRRARPRAARRGLRGHVGAGAAERRGRAGRRDGARQPVRQPDHGRPRRGPAAAGPQRQRALQRGVRLRRRGPGRVDDRPVAGTARRWSTSAATCSARASGSPTGRAARSSTSTSTGSARSGCGRAPSTTTGARHDERVAAVPHRSSSSCEPPTGDIGLRRKVDRFPFVPDDAERLALDCYEAYNIQVSGLEQRLARDRRAQGRDRRQRRPRLDPRADRRGQGDGPARPPAQRRARLHDARLRDRRDHQVLRHPARKALGVTFEELDIRPAAEQMLEDLGHPYGRRREGLRRHLRERPGRAALRLPVPARQPARRHRRRHRRPRPSSRSAGAPTASATRCRTTRQRRRPEDARAAPDPLGDRHGEFDEAAARCSARSSSWRSPPS